MSRVEREADRSRTYDMVDAAIRRVLLDRRRPDPDRLLGSLRALLNASDNWEDGYDGYCPFDPVDVARVLRLETDWRKAVHFGHTTAEFVWQWMFTAVDDETEAWGCAAEMIDVVAALGGLPEPASEGDQG
jgi:hypothetical protein